MTQNIAENMDKVFGRPATLVDRTLHYCPGCGHSLTHRLVAETIDELGIADRTIGVAGVGCAWNCYDYFDLDFVYSLHGRAPAVATGLKRSNPDSIVFTYQGDGDLAAIGMAETVHAAARGERITVIFVNNAVYGMTGAQMAPTSLLGQVTTTSPYGRDESQQGFPIRVSEFLATLDGPSYIERVAVDTPANIRKAKKAIRHAFELQMAGASFNVVEILSQCPEGWRMSTTESLEWLRENMMKQYPLGRYK
jgi:2-oxoglutarate ferredoxin oxidoreductase subunit beta